MTPVTLQGPLYTMLMLDVIYLTYLSGGTARPASAERNEPANKLKYFCARSLAGTLSDQGNFSIGTALTYTISAQWIPWQNTQGETKNHLELSH